MVTFEKLDSKKAHNQKNTITMNQFCELGLSPPGRAKFDEAQKLAELRCENTETNTACVDSKVES